MYEWPTTHPTSDAAQYTSPGAMPYTLRMLQCSATACPPLSRMTPLGTPVVPDVYSTYSGSVAATLTHGTGCEAATASAQSRSRPSYSFATACGRCTITQ